MRTMLGAGISDTEASTQKWAATIAFMALQTTNYNLTTAQVCGSEDFCVLTSHMIPQPSLAALHSTSVHCSHSHCNRPHMPQALGRPTPCICGHSFYAHSVPHADVCISSVKQYSTLVR